MSKWHEYGETPHDFPEVWDTPECGAFYDAEYVKDWLKRCLENTPSAYLSAPWKAWFNAWFSQFIEKGEDENDQ